MEYTLTAAAETTGISKSTIHRAIQKGRLSARKLEDGTFRIYGAELARVYPPSPVGHPEASPWDSKGQAEMLRDEKGTELAVLRVKVEMLEAALGRERQVMGEAVDDLRRRLDQETEERRALQRQLAPPAPERAQGGPTTAPGATEPATAPRGILAGWLAMAGRR